MLHRMTLFIVACALGCASSPEPMRVKFADIDKGALAGYDGTRPIVVEFFPGERVPVDFELTGDGFELEPLHPPMQLVVKEHAFVRIGRDGFRISADPNHFDAKPRQRGTFRVGFGAIKGQAAKVTVAVAAPRR